MRITCLIIMALTVVLSFILEQNVAEESNQKTMAKGVVYHDVNGDGKFNSPDKPLPNIKVSNGRTIVRTGSDGTYYLPVDDDTILFVIKPRSWRPPLSKHKLPRFYYIHKPKGSPQLKYKGVAPTGPLPGSIFPSIHKTSRNSSARFCSAILNRAIRRKSITSPMMLWKN